MVKVELDTLPYTLQNLPYGVFSTKDDVKRRCAVAIGKHAIDLAKWSEHCGLEHEDVRLMQSLTEPTLNLFASLGTSTRKMVRRKLQEDIRQARIPDECFVLLTDAIMHLPMDIRGFSDFYTSLEHCQNCSGEMTNSAIAKNWWYAPSVYNGRASSVVPSPASFPRPTNVAFSDGVDSTPHFTPSRKMDFELELGYFVSSPVDHGLSTPIARAREHIFGFVMLNDWSARDHQLFEMRPLGPFHAKGFATGISNWIVPIEALEPFSCAPHTAQDPKPFPHLTWPTPQDGALDIKLRIKLVRDGKESVLGTSNLKYLYWTPYQQLTHHAQSGCGMQAGDLIGTGTISGSGVTENGDKAELGCLYEAERTKTSVLPQGTGLYDPGYLEDGDEIVLEGWCEDEQGRTVLGFGECRGKIEPPQRPDVVRHGESLKA